MKVLRIKRLSYKNIVKEVTFDWRQGEVIALMGANGSGKSTLARLITGLNESTSGTVELLRKEGPLPWPRDGRWREIGFIGQHPRRQTIGASVAEELGFGLLNLGFPLQDVQLRVKELAAAVGLEGRENQSPSTLSGGERQRLVMASILAMKPSFLILDEALTMLDQKAEDKILSLLLDTRLNGEAPMGQLFITHDPQLALRADRLLLMKDGQIKDAGLPSTALTNQNLRNEYGIRSEYKMGNYVSDIGHQAGTQIKDSQPIADEKKQPPKYKKVLEWNHCTYGERLKVDKSIYEGEFIGIIGPSGAGKTTLLESVIGLNLVTAGQFEVFGEVLKKENLMRLRQQCRLVLQEPGEYFIGHTVYDEVFYGYSRREMKNREDEHLKYLGRFGITAEMAVKPPERLSGGEKQRVALAAAFESDPQVLLLDEPMLGLDGRGQGLLLSYLRSLKRQITILCVTHDLTEVSELADRLWLVEDGQVTLDFPASAWPDYREHLLAAGVRCPELEGVIL